VLFSFKVQAPANTPSTAPQWQRLPLDAGVIRKVVIQIPHGHAGLAHLRVFRGSSQVIPANEDEDLSGDGLILEFDEEWIPLLQPPYELLAEAWNEDDTYDHTFYLHLQLIRREEYLASKGMYFPGEGFV